jgi:hypothetical protein
VAKKLPPLDPSELAADAFRGLMLAVIISSAFWLALFAIASQLIGDNA